MEYFFQRFPATFYDALGNGERKLVTQILQRVRFREVVQTNNMVFYPLVVSEGETPETIAFKYYGSPHYHWLVLMSNEILDVNEEWPLSYEVLQEVIRKMYGTPARDGLEYAYGTIHHYEDFRGNVVDYQTFLTLADNERRAVSIYDYEDAKNEAKRQIQLLDKIYVPQVEDELKKILVAKILT